MRYASSLCVVLMVSTIAMAAPINYSESVSGDLPTFAPPPTFVFDAGLNTVSGNSGHFAPVDFDSFAFTIQPGQQLIAASLVLNQITGGAITLGFGWQLFNSANLLLASFNPTAPSAGPIFNSALPLGPGTYRITPTFISTVGGNGYSDYTFSFLVTPEPATIAVFGMMTLSVGAYGVRRRRAIA